MPELLGQNQAADRDDGLVRRLKCGSSEAFEELLDSYQGPIYGFVFRLLDDSSEAADVTQEVFLKVFRKIEGFRSECSLKTWLYRIAVHEAANRRRWFSRHRRNELSVDAEREDVGLGWTQLADQRGTPFDWLEQREQIDIVESCLREIDSRLRAAVVLRDIEGHSYNEIAETLEISLGTVKSRILRGREALKTRLEKRLRAAAPDAWSLQTE